MCYGMTKADADRLMYEQSLRHTYFLHRYSVVPYHIGPEGEVLSYGVWRERWDSANWRWSPVGFVSRLI